jgi:hypothetical protein
VAGLKTGFDPARFEFDAVALAGFEKDRRDSPDCDIVKSP